MASETSQVIILYKFLHFLRWFKRKLCQEFEKWTI